MTKIYGTLGPGCADARTLEKMFKNGMTGVRLNLSHSTLEDAEGWLSELWIAAGRCGIKPDLLIDMQGPEIRVGRLKNPLVLEDGDEVCLYVTDQDAEKGRDDADSDSGKARIPVPGIVMPYLKRGQQVLLDDGRILLEVTSEAKATVLRGGRLLSGKSIALPGTGIWLPAMTENDRMHIRMAKEYGVTGIMQPFVRNIGDLETVRKALDEAGGSDIKIYAKIENPDGVNNLEKLLPAADEFIIARGDLGNSMPLWELPAVQKKIAKECRAAGKPFMVVTQMLASMENAAVPTRAEVSDVFNAVLDGASSVMVTGETAVGKYPAEVIKYLANTARSASKYLSDDPDLT